MLNSYWFSQTKGKCMFSYMQRKLGGSINVKVVVDFKKFAVKMVVD